MRTILTIIIACLLSPSLAISVQSVEQQEQQEEVTNSSESKQPITTEKPRESEILDFSGTGRPGQQTAGESRGTCANVAQPMTAVIPESNSGTTVLGHPSFWVHLPELAAETTEVEFIIQDESRKDIWRSRSLVNSTTGYQHFSLPTTEKPLEIDQWYRWYVKVYCDQQIASVQYVQGWINRIPLSSQLHLELQKNSSKNHHRIYGRHRIWYDTMNQLLTSYHRDPHNLALESDWQNLIRAKGVKLDTLPSVGSEQISQQK